jgi:hypothetical protein
MLSVGAIHKVQVIKKQIFVYCIIIVQIANKVGCKKKFQTIDNVQYNIGTPVISSLSPSPVPVTIEAILSSCLTFLSSSNLRHGLTTPSKLSS